MFRAMASMQDYFLTYIYLGHSHLAIVTGLGRL